MDIGKIIRRLAGRCHAAAYLFIPVIRLKDRLEGGRMHAELDRCLTVFPAPEQRADRAWLRRTRRDMWYSFLLYHASFSEYFVYLFPRLSHEGRREFVTEAEKNELCKGLSREEVWSRIWDKWSAYELFRPYYRRDAVKLGEDADFADFAAFVEKHPRFIAKPRLESCGTGVTIFDAAAPEFDARALFDSLCAGGTICEELIVQAEPFAGLHPGSVNTVRMATLVREDGPVLLFSFLRIGRGDSIVDNAGAGGFVALIDGETGIVMTPGTTETHEKALVHPDTGRQIIGLSIPQWDGLRALSLELAMRYPEHPYISWDFAYTAAGWVVVEANCMGQFICPQFTTEHGIRSYLRQYFPL